MTAKEFLLQYKQAVLYVERLTKEYCAQLELIDDINSPLGGDGTPGGGSISRTTENKAMRLIDKTTELKEAKEEAIRIRQEVVDMVNRIQNEKGDILYERYINLIRDQKTGRLRKKTWEEVGEAVGYSERQARNLHDEALNDVQHFLLFPF